MLFFLGDVGRKEGSLIVTPSGAERSGVEES